MTYSIAKLSIKDWCHEFSLSICAVLALASILTPLIVLHGVHTGVIDQMRNRLMQDPSVLVMIPTGSRGAGFTGDFIESIIQRDECIYAIGRIRNVASELQLTNARGKNQIVSIEATSKGDPMLERNGITEFPVSSAEHFKMVLTHEAAKRLEVKAGDKVSASFGRRLSSGKLERMKLTVEITGVLPAGASHMTVGFIAPDFLMAVQNYRDGFSVGLFGVDGDKKTSDEEYFESFRAYVKDLDSVESLEKWFKSNHIEVKTRSRDIANIRHVDRVLGTIILVITVTSSAGFFAFMLSTVHAGIRRKWKMLGMLRLLGYSKLSILLFPVVQVLFTGVLGTTLAFCLYSGVSHLIDTLFATDGAGSEICIVYRIDFIVIFIAVQIMVVISSLKSALKASEIDPSIVIRET